MIQEINIEAKNIGIVIQVTESTKETKEDIQEGETEITEEEDQDHLHIEAKTVMTEKKKVSMIKEDLDITMMIMVQNPDLIMMTKEEEGLDQKDHHQVAEEERSNKETRNKKIQETNHLKIEILEENLDPQEIENLKDQLQDLDQSMEAT